MPTVRIEALTPEDHAAADTLAQALSLPRQGEAILAM